MRISGQFWTGLIQLLFTITQTTQNWVFFVYHFSRKLMVFSVKQEYLVFFDDNEPKNFIREHDSALPH